MLTIKLKYFLFCSLLSCVLCLKAQAPKEDSQAVINIIGDDPIQSNISQDLTNSNPYDQPKEPPGKKQKILQNQDIEPTLENGFHMRFEISYAQPLVPNAGTAFAADGEDNGNKIKKRSGRLTERRINLKKRLRKYIPARKKKYRPTICGRF